MWLCVYIYIRQLWSSRSCSAHYLSPVTLSRCQWIKWDAVATGLWNPMLLAGYQEQPRDWLCRHFIKKSAVPKKTWQNFLSKDLPSNKFIKPSDGCFIRSLGGGSKKIKEVGRNIKHRVSFPTHPIGNRNPSSSAGVPQNEITKVFIHQNLIYCKILHNHFIPFLKSTKNYKHKKYGTPHSFSRMLPFIKLRELPWSASTGWHKAVPWLPGIIVNACQRMDPPSSTNIKWSSCILAMPISNGDF